MENQQIRQLIRQELPAILQNDYEFREWVLTLTQGQYADKSETTSRFDRVLAELQHDREENTRKWEANQQELRVLREEQNRKWEEQNRKWEANQQELRVLREEQNRKWEEQNRKWEEQNRKWEVNQQELRAMREESATHFDQMFTELRERDKRYQQGIGALGARWGIQSEVAFRNALAGILTESFGVKVQNVTEYDEEGVVFDHPDQVELDVIIQNGVLILCELKSSVSRGDVTIFARKVAFYERRHSRKATRKLIISPMVDSRAQVVAQQLGIEVYSFAEDVWV